ncbi:hypothetical protein [Limnoglobus roseus]|uniref:Uncharacterized protein n=1 Tax=Limnoglobus roseus TaxID=2598579 RepID=A0A5C1AJP8_9BACT|nr:hypothetical protein [Limnoglobus roseus]QEL18905.1 hypothetical protein PX52LOC_05954 [Limnoglobus roseus]
MESLRFEQELDGSLYRVTKARVDEYFRATGKCRRAGFLLAFKSLSARHRDQR